jgi:transcriptional regulator with XRE-family HTH domain
MSPGAQSAFSEKLRHLIAIEGITQTELATRTGIDRVDLNRMVNDKREPKPHEVALLAVALKVKPEELAADVNQDEVKVFVVIAQRLLGAEDSSTERLLELQAATQAHAATEARWNAERQELIAETTAARRDAANRVAEIEAAAAERAAQYALRVREQTALLAQRDAEIVRLSGFLAANRQTIAELRSKLASEGGKQLFAGLIGALAGAAIASSGDD